MTPKEKAKELVSRFNFEHLGDRYVLHQTVEESKRCALIAVNEIINAIDWNESEYPVSEELFWLEVIKEIEKL